MGLFGGHGDRICARSARRPTGTLRRYTVCEEVMPGIFLAANRHAVSRHWDSRGRQQTEDRMKDVTQPAKARGKMLSAVALAVALAASLALAPFASATSDPVAGGTTTVTLSKGLFKKLKKKKVKTLKLSPGKVKNRKVTLPVGGGSMDPTNGLGSLELNGGFKFKRGKKQAPVKRLVLDTAHSSLKGKVANKQMKIASVVGLSYSRNGFGVNVKVTKLKLTSKAAKRLNQKLGFGGKSKKKSKRATGSKESEQGPFKGGQVLGGSSSESQPKTVAVVATSKADLLTNETTVKTFVLPPPTGLAVKIEPIEPTELVAEENPFTPLLRFPISGGSIAPDASSGIVETNGGVKLVQELEVGTTTMTLANIWVDLGAKTATVEVTVESTISPELNLGSLGARSSIADLNLAGATIVSDPTNRTVSVQNATATLQLITAETLNSIFGAPFDAFEIPHGTFKEGDGLGTFSFTAQTQ
ncbi:MAG: HtaA domain-containing protein [Chloroflexota bacterium]